MKTIRETIHHNSLISDAMYMLENVGRSMPRFHSSEHVGEHPTVTVFERSNKTDDFAQILCGIDDGQPTHAFASETQPPVKDTWAYITKAVIHGPTALHDRIIGLQEF